jgi:hypothetical protein
MEPLDRPWNEKPWSTTSSTSDTSKPPDPVELT